MKAILLFLSAVLMVALFGACGTAVTGHDHLHRPVYQQKMELDGGAVKSLRPLPFLNNRQVYYWKYNDQIFTIDMPTDERLNEAYDSAKINYRLNQGWSKFLDRLPNDTAVTSIARQLKIMAKLNDFSDSQLAALTSSFVQSLSYDFAEAKALPELMNDQALSLYKTPYQVLYQRRGICLDKSLLGIALLRELGFGSALIVLSGHEHAAFGIKCESEYSTAPFSNYRYVEATVSKDIGVLPLIMNGKKVDKATIILEQDGKLYTGITTKN
ncbi:MAG TPA: transglutaminase-like domain-containing protein [bacterium]|nr:transglutaminase-like domain-containing protein [bacterium]